MSEHTSASPRTGSVMEMMTVGLGRMKDLSVVRNLVVSL